MLQALQGTLWHKQSCKLGKKMKVYRDAPSARYEIILFGDDKILAMFSCSSTKKYEHSTTSDIEGLVRSLRAFNAFILGQKFIVYSDNWSVMELLCGKTKLALVLRRLEEIISWYLDIQFVKGTANTSAD